jgi:hypothetical protein
MNYSQKNIFGMVLDSKVDIDSNKHMVVCLYGIKWITREHAKEDGIACPWLIKNFIDKEAEFLFLPTHKVIK